MQFVGIDVGKSKHAVCVKNEKDEVLHKISIHNTLTDFQKVEGLI